MATYAWKEVLFIEDGIRTTPVLALLPAGGQGHAPELEPGLYRKFLRLPLKPESVLEFANRHGSLGVGEPCILPGKKRSLVLVGETLEAWGKHITGMRDAFEAYQLATSHRARADKRKDLRKHVLRHASGGIGFRASAGAYYLISAPTYRPAHLGRIGNNDSVALLFATQNIINKVLRECVFPVMSWNGERNRPILSVRSTSLIGRLWLQLARAVSAGAKFEMCPMCENWIEHSREQYGGARIDREYCSDACKQKAYRERKAAAKKGYRR